MGQKPCIFKGEGGGRKPFMRSIKCNFVLKLTKSYIGHEDNQSFILWNNSHYSPMYYHPYHRKAFRFVLADNYKLISGPSFWQWFWKPFLFFFPFLKASCDFSCIILKEYCHDELARCTKPFIQKSCRVQDPKYSGSELWNAAGNCSIVNLCLSSSFISFKLEIILQIVGNLTNGQPKIL